MRVAASGPLNVLKRERNRYPLPSVNSLRIDARGRGHGL
jgi:hypothetical protein